MMFGAGPSMAIVAAIKAAGAAASVINRGQSGNPRVFYKGTNYFDPTFGGYSPGDDPKYWMGDGTRDKDGSGEQFWKDFDRFYSVDMQNEMPSGKHYIFICRPDLYLVSNEAAAGGKLELCTESKVAYDPYFQYLAKFHPQIISSLTGEFVGVGTMSKTPLGASAGSGYGNSGLSDGSYAITNKGARIPLTMHAFIPFLTSRIESMQLPDYTLKTGGLVQPYTKYTVPYTASAIESSTGGTFEITFREDRNYSLHKLFYAWAYYQNNVMRNIFRPKDKYLMYNALDYATSIYDFIVDETGENVVYWAKYTGCVLNSVNMSDLSFNKGGTGEGKISVPFSYFYCEHMDRNSLVDFQYNSLGYIAMRQFFTGDKEQMCPPIRTIPMYNADTFIGRNLVGRPVIKYAEDGDRPQIKLQWL